MPGVSLFWRDGDLRVMEMFTNGFAMRLEFGNGFQQSSCPEKFIFACRTRRKVTSSGTFTAEIQRFPTTPLAVKAARHPAMPKSVAGKNVGARTDFRLEAEVLRLLAERKQTLALAESCTGGCLAHRLTNVPGASAVFLGGVVAYSNAAKQKFLGVRTKTLAAHGAVSEAVAREMAEGARRKFGADFALGVTGIAGPGRRDESQAGGDGFHRVGRGIRNHGGAEIKCL